MTTVLASMSQSSPRWEPALNPIGLTELEVAAGDVFGDGHPETFPPRPELHPLAALREVAVEHLSRPPCVIAFSGGRDSSALLALFVDVARRESLPDPIAVTARWDGDAASDESAWQEQVVSHIGLTDWEVLRPGDTLDLLGDEATSALSKIGLMWPAPTYAFRPMMRMAAGGTFVSGEGGDEAFGLWPYGRAWDTLRRRRLPRQGDLRALALGISPRRVREWRWRQKLPPYQHWLRADAYRAITQVFAAEMASDPLRWDRYQYVNRARRGPQLSLRTLAAMSRIESASYAGPLLDTRFVTALAAWGRGTGRGDRSSVMTALFSELLPERVLTRVSKATFGGVFFGPKSRDFVEQWDGSGVNASLVDAAKLREALSAPIPAYGTALPLHAVWLATLGRSALERVDTPVLP